MTPLVVILAVAVGASTAALVLVLMPTIKDSALEQRLGAMGPVDLTPLLDPVDVDLQRPIGERVVAPMMQWLGHLIMRRTPSAQLDALRLTLARAGSTQRAETLLAMRVVLVPVGAGVGLVIVDLLNLGGLVDFLGPLALAILGYMYPTSSLRGKIKKRTREIRTALPGVLDLLTISMEAGLSLDMAMMRVCEADETILGHEFQKVINEVRLGRQRGEALLAMAERNDVEELGGFVNAVVQAEPLGVSVANVLRIQSEELRRLRKQRAEQAGHRAPVLMLLPMMGCIFPCVFICLLGPAVLSIVTPH